MKTFLLSALCVGVATMPCCCPDDSVESSAESQRAFVPQESVDTLPPSEELSPDIVEWVNLCHEAQQTYVRNLVQSFYPDNEVQSRTDALLEKLAAMQKKVLTNMAYLKSADCPESVKTQLIESLPERQRNQLLSLEQLDSPTMLQSRGCTWSQYWMEQVKSELRIIKNQWVPEIPKESSDGSLRRDSAVLAFIEASDIERSNRLGLIRHLDACYAAWKSAYSTASRVDDIYEDDRDAQFVSVLVKALMLNAQQDYLKFLVNDVGIERFASEPCRFSLGDYPAMYWMPEPPEDEDKELFEEFRNQMLASYGCNFDYSDISEEEGKTRIAKHMEQALSDMKKMYHSQMRYARLSLAMVERDKQDKALDDYRFVIQKLCRNDVEIVCRLANWVKKTDSPIERRQSPVVPPWAAIISKTDWYSTAEGCDLACMADSVEDSQREAVRKLIMAPRPDRREPVAREKYTRDDVINPHLHQMSRAFEEAEYLWELYLTSMAELGSVDLGKWEGTLAVFDAISRVKYMTHNHDLYYLYLLAPDIDRLDYFLEFEE